MQIGHFFKNIKPEYKNYYFSGFSFDSKQCKNNYIFFVIKGTTNDGALFINDAIKNGAKIILYKVQKPEVFGVAKINSNNKIIAIK